LNVHFDVAPKKLGTYSVVYIKIIFDVSATEDFSFAVEGL